MESSFFMERDFLYPKRVVTEVENLSKYIMLRLITILVKANL